MKLKSDHIQGHVERDPVTKEVDRKKVVSFRCDKKEDIISRQGTWSKGKVQSIRRRQRPKNDNEHGVRQCDQMKSLDTGTLLSNICRLTSLQINAKPSTHSRTDSACQNPVPTAQHEECLPPDQQPQLHRWSLLLVFDA
ncbi:unnamed protein product [Soboliphyme baturini]|uniref:Uncharacterized protein n=1 Tax=Soboliphyme baturini TaxID=241478 RepID=A0A183J6M4_9BILA|nr:unnamed protein product [Soboliphyme baturini]